MAYFDQLLGGFFGSLKKRIEKQIEKYIENYVKKILTTVAWTSAGVVMLLAGMLYVLQGIIIYLGELMPMYLSWAIVGIIIIMTGIILLMHARSRFQN
ncbi:MAG: hypothetical protein LUP94_01790 [Candidatus Methanomethylicus sp.]|nr:hypothetical protein [Candidatus Methanomethylicus sp.]